jgi:hypothetical protein
MKKLLSFLGEWLSTLPAKLKAGLQNPQVRRIILSVVIIIGGGVLIVIIGSALVQFINQNIGTVILLVAVAGGGFVLYSRRAYYQKQVRAWQAEQARSVNASATAVQNQALQNSFIIIQKILHGILTPLAANYGLLLPPITADFTSPNKWVERQGIIVYQYLIAKAKGVAGIDTASIQNVIQTTITNRASERRLEGISQSSYLYNGVVLPPMYVDSVKELNRDFIEINVVIMTEGYAEYLRLKSMATFGSKGVDLLDDEV